MVKRLDTRLAGLFILAVLLGVMAFPVAAHQTKGVGDGEFLLSVGFVKEPIYTDERNGLDLIVRRAEDGEPIDHVQDTMFAEIIAPDGVTKREMLLRAQYGQPGRYTSDILLTQPGLYKVRIWGYIHHVEFDVIFDLHEVLSLDTLRFPN